ncbi:MAG: UDP-glucose 4-epimerase GalE [Cyclobacteriaceae bacterium]|nr:UDP-glucose 4-epimerase GalE [Cyclobacteriaceae bacterium]
MPNSRKVLVTGGAGYIGSHTVVSLAQADYQPVILDNYSNSSPQVIDGLENILGEKVIHYRADCCDQQEVLKILKQEQISGAIHFAASKAVGESVTMPLHYYYNNLNSLVVLLKSMNQLAITNFVFSSSCTVYGQPDELPVTEETAPKPAESPYGNTKKIGEDIIHDVVNSKVGLKAVSLRYFNPIGAHSSAKIGELPIGAPSNLIPFITQTAAGIREKITIFGDDYQTVDGTCVRDYIHVVDLAQAHVRALDYLQEQSTDNFYEVFNLGTGSGTTVMEVVQTFERVTGVKLNYEIGPRRQGDVEQIYASVEKASSVLNWQASKGLDEALAAAWKWQQSLSKHYD